MTSAAGRLPGGVAPGAPAPPAYGTGSLADLSGSVLAALDVPGEANVLGLAELPRACVLLIDGLGWELLRANRDVAPYLSALLPSGRSLTAGFPSTTATSLTSLGTGRPPGGHGMLGYQIAIPGAGRLLNCLKWDDAVDPYTWQPRSTAFERAERAGVATTHVAPRAFRETGLTLAGLRGSGSYPGGNSLGEVAAHTAAALAATPRAYVFAYHADLDSTGHRVGCASEAWRLQLGQVDRLVEQIAARLPADAALYVTADHGMVDATDRVDVEETPELLDGVELLGGEPRARQLYTRAGAAADVAAAWRGLLGDRAWILTREEAIAAGWFGPVADGTDGSGGFDVTARIGDVLAVPYGPTGFFATRSEPGESRLIGMHGSLEPSDLLVPLLTARR
ncbi:MAG TPA: alkaline phosphatase family protein [Streptosporangiaceae bacterium]